MKRVYVWLMLLPSLVLLVTFVHYPTVATFIDSFFSNKTVFRPRTFVGFENYNRLLNDNVFLVTLKNTFIYSFGTIPFVIALSLAMALFVNQKFVGRGVVRLIYFTPTILPMVAVANIWLFFYSPEIGLFNKILNIFGYQGYNWLGDIHTVLPSIMVMTIWKEAGFFMIFYLAALQSLPKELYEAAKIEGANRRTIFFRITFPLLMPTTFFVMVNAVLNAFKLVDHIMILTKGGPDNASNLLLYYIYETAFAFFDNAYASTLTVVLLIILIFLSLFQFLFIEKKIHYA